ncbi:MAG: acyl-CoA thioesterase [Pseudomonadota bacterium]
MFSMTIMPRFCETDALGHINNTVLSQWFETAREPVFRIFNPELSLPGWNLILARVEIDYVAQTHYGRSVDLRTWIGKVGNSSFVVEQEAWQEGACVARGKAVQVFFNYVTQKSEALPAEFRRELEKHLRAAA